MSISCLSFHCSKKSWPKTSIFRQGKKRPPPAVDRRPTHRVLLDPRAAQHYTMPSEGNQIKSWIGDHRPPRSVRTKLKLVRIQPICYHWNRSKVVHDRAIARWPPVCNRGIEVTKTIAVAGKGGTGKTTISALVIDYLAKNGQRFGPGHRRRSQYQSESGPGCATLRYCG